MFKNSFTSRLRSRAGSFLVASSIAVATIAVAGLTESPVRAAPVSWGNITATRAIASDGTFNVYQGEQVYAYVFSQIQSPPVTNLAGNCLGVELQPGDVLSLTASNFTFSNVSFNYGANTNSQNSWTLPDPVPFPINISADTSKLPIATAATTLTFNPGLTVTRAGNPLVSSFGTCYVEKTAYARINATTTESYDDLGNVSQYETRVGDTRLSYNAKACVDMTLVAPGDVLTYAYELKTGGQPAETNGAAPNYNWSRNMGGNWPGNTILDPEPEELDLRLSSAMGAVTTSGQIFTFSLDIKKGNDSVAVSCPTSTPSTSTPDTSTPSSSTPSSSTPNTSTPGCINNCGGLPPPMNMPRLYPTGQVSLVGQLTLGSTLTVSLPSWSLTDGGPALAGTAIQATQFTWLLCNVGPDAQRTDITTPMAQCMMSNQTLLADGNSFGSPTGPGQVYSGSSLTITQPLLNALASKYLMVSVFVETAPAQGQMMGVFFSFNFKSCAPGENCADSFGPTSTPDTSAPSSSTPSSSTPSSSTPTTAAEAASSSTTSSTTTTVPPPALATVQALPVAPTPIIADATISTGEEITISFGGFTPFEFVQLIVASTPQVIGSGYADAQGVVTLRGNLPSNLASGNHTLAVFAPVSGVGFTQPITVSQPLLPATGSDGQNNLFVIAMLLFVLGLVVRRSSTVTTNK